MSRWKPDGIYRACPFCKGEFVVDEMPHPEHGREAVVVVHVEPACVMYLQYDPDSYLEAVEQKKAGGGVS